tara:strand:+ start:660 stop:1025 length:366 start_codon:yes stop_codon:yes gene_type:complete
MDEIFIAGNVPSSKNGKRWTGKYLIHSKTVMNYIKNTKEDWLKNKEKFEQLIQNKELPYKVSFKFIRNSRRKFDYINPCQTVQDLMVKYEYIQDDNCENVIPFFEEYEYNKENSGVIIKIL